MLEITSSHNPKIKAAHALKDRRERDTHALFLIEGYRELKRAIDHGIKIESLFICPELFLGDNENALIQAAKEQGATIYLTRPHLVEKLSYRERSDGLVAVAC